MSEDKLITFNQATKALGHADIVVIQCKNSGDRVVADFVGWEEEGDPESDFVIGAEGWDDVYVPWGQKILRQGHVIKPNGYGVVLEMYTAKK